MLRAAERIVDGSPVNAGRDDRITIKQAAELIFGLADCRPNAIHHDLSKPQGVASRAADLTRARKTLRMGTKDIVQRQFREDHPMVLWRREQGRNQGKSGSPSTRTVEPRGSMPDTEKQWIRGGCWAELLEKMPIPCVDVIVHRGQDFLMGWRTIPPYRDVWALLGGRMLRGESFAKAAARHCRKSGIAISNPNLMGLYPVRFATRHDITICVEATIKSGVTKPTNEIARYRWCHISDIERISPIGRNYRKMLLHWRSTKSRVSTG